MNYLKISKQQNNLNNVENFVEDICDSFNIKNLFHGNVIMALSEIVSIVTKLGGEGKLTFENKNEFFVFKCQIDSISKNITDIFNDKDSNLELESDYEKSIFLIMALCDDFVIEENNSTITLVFKKDAIENDISNHRKEYLSNYLGKTIETLNKDNA